MSSFSVNNHSDRWPQNINFGFAFFKFPLLILTPICISFRDEVSVISFNPWKKLFSKEERAPVRITPEPSIDDVSSKSKREDEYKLREGRDVLSL